jgi:phage shock protein A
MAGNDRDLLVVLEDCVLDMKNLCDERKRRIVTLEASLKEKEERVLQTERSMAALKTKYDNLLTARRLADNKEAFQQTRKQVNQLVREVDLCIALLNE